MPDEPKIKALSEPWLCSHCGTEINPNEGGLRHYGTHVAHSENRCLEVLKAENARLQQQLAAEWEARDAKNVAYKSLSDERDQLRQQIASARVCDCWKVVEATRPQISETLLGERIPRRLGFDPDCPHCTNGVRFDPIS